MPHQSASDGDAGPSAAADDPPKLDSLPSQCLQHIACIGGQLSVASKLNSTSRGLREMLQLHRLEGNGAMRVWGAPIRGSTAPSVVKYDPSTLTLTKTTRPGFPLVVIPGRLTTTSALVEFEITSLEAIGGVQLGVLLVANGQPCTDDVRRRVSFDGVGRVEAGLRDGSLSDVETRAHGVRFREGDVVGLLYCAASCSVSLTLHGRLAGPPIPLSRPALSFSAAAHTACHAAFHFFLRFDAVPGLQVRYVTRPTEVIDATAFLSQLPRPPAPLRPEAPNVLVREVGPDSRLWGVRLAADGTGTVGELRAAMAPLLNCDARQLEIRVRPPHTSRVAMRTETVLTNDAEQLRDLGIWLEPNGAQMVPLYADVPMMIG